MGKRKMHGYTFYQCDWTGYPMRATNCYMPVWTNDKMVKRGSYCNWESVLAHSQFLHDNNDASAAQCARVHEYVHELTGITLGQDVLTLPRTALPGHDLSGFHFTHLEHFKDDSAVQATGSVKTMSQQFGGNWDMATYHKVCQAVTCNFELTAVKLSPEGEIFEVMLTSQAGKYKFDDYLTTPYMSSVANDYLHAVQSFCCTHKPRMPKERDVTVFYYPFKNGLPLNAAASTLFKMQIFGDALLVQQTKEACFMPRERYVHFTKQLFDDIFGKKKKKPVEVPALTDNEFKEAREGMVASLSEFERRVTDGAERPGDLIRGAVMPPSSGKELMEVAELKNLGPPPLVRQGTIGKRAFVPAQCWVVPAQKGFDPDEAPLGFQKRQKGLDQDEAAPVAMEA